MGNLGQRGRNSKVRSRDEEAGTRTLPQVDSDL